MKKTWGGRMKEGLMTKGYVDSEGKGGVNDDLS